MSFITSTGPAGLKLTSFDFSIVEDMTLVEWNSQVISWVGANGDFLTIMGRGLQPVVAGGVLVDINQGFMDSLSLRHGTRSMDVLIWDEFFSAFDFHNVVETGNAKALARMITRDDDVIQGTAAGDVLAGGKGFDMLTGNGGNDRLLGGDRSDMLHGGRGNDTMVGGDGTDIFYFDFAPTQGGVDHIADFNRRKDLIGIAGDLFPNVGPKGGMTNHWFFNGPPEREGRQGIIYIEATGQIFSDADGRGPAPMILFATVEPGLHLTAGDFFVF